MLLSFNLKGQNQSLDTLLLEYQEAQIDDTTKVILLNDIAYQFHRVDIDSSEHYAKLSLENARKIGFQKGECRALNILGIVATYNGDFNQSLRVNSEAYEISKRLNNYRLIAASTNGLCVTYDRLNNNKQSIKYGKIALESAEKMNDTLHISYIMSNLSDFHLEEGNHQQATLYNDQVINFGTLSKDCLLLSIGYQQLGKIRFEKNELNSAMESFNQSLSQSEECKDDYMSSLTYAGISKIQLAHSNFKLAKEFIDKSNNILKKVGDIDIQMENNLIESEILLEQNLQSLAIEKLHEGLEYARKFKKFDFEKDYLEQLSSIYKTKGDYKQAFLFEEQRKIANDSIVRLNNAITMIELENKYNFEKKEVEVQLLQEQKNKDAQIIKSRSYQMITIGLLALLIGAIALFTWLNLKKEAKYNSQLELKVKERTQELQLSNQMLSKSNEELERFAYISSHDLKQPLKNIISFTKLINQEALKLESPKISEYSNILENCSQQLNTLVSDILDYSLVKNNYRIQDVDLNTIVDQLQSDLDETLKSKNAIIVSNPLPTIKSDKSKMYQAFKNLIENGLKYNESEKPVVKIKSEESSDNWRIQFTDNGIGIDPKHHEKIFTMFNRLHSQEEYPGSGIGLSTLKTIIEKLSGKITLDSKPGSGSKFTITLPKN